MLMIMSVYITILQIWKKEGQGHWTEYEKWKPHWQTKQCNVTSSLAFLRLLTFKIGQGHWGQHAKVNLTGVAITQSMADLI